MNGNMDMNMNYYEIGQRIRKNRKALELSQEELAEKVGISATHMSHIETGNTKLSLAVFAKLAKALGCRADDLLFERPASSKHISSENILMTLDSCTLQQLLIIEEIIVAAKRSLDKNL